MRLPTTTATGSSSTPMSPTPQQQSSSSSLSTPRSGGVGVGGLMSSPYSPYSTFSLLTSPAASTTTTTSPNTTTVHKPIQSSRFQTHHIFFEDGRKPNGPCSTGIGYLDHMLDQFNTHAQIGLKISIDNLVTTTVKNMNTNNNNTKDDNNTKATTNNIVLFDERNRHAKYSIEQEKLMRLVGNKVGKAIRRTIDKKQQNGIEMGRYSRFACPLDEALIVCTLERRILSNNNNNINTFNNSGSNNMNAVGGPPMTTGNGSGTTGGVGGGGVVGGGDDSSCSTSATTVSASGTTVASDSELASLFRLGHLDSYTLPPYGIYPKKSGRKYIGALETSMLIIFWESLAEQSGLHLRIEKIRGTNAHHIVEASFKAFCRALRNLLDGTNTDTKDDLIILKEKQQQTKKNGGFGSNNNNNRNVATTRYHFGSTRVSSTTTTANSPTTNSGKATPTTADTTTITKEKKEEEEEEKTVTDDDDGGDNNNYNPATTTTTATTTTATTSTMDNTNTKTASDSSGAGDDADNTNQGSTSEAAVDDSGATNNIITTEETTTTTTVEESMTTAHPDTSATSTTNTTASPTVTPPKPATTTTTTTTTSTPLSIPVGILNNSGSSKTKRRYNIIDDDDNVREYKDREKAFDRLRDMYGMKSDNYIASSTLQRIGTVSRNTKETNIDCKLTLTPPVIDGNDIPSKDSRINTGIVTLDNFLYKLVQEANIDLKLTCKGDLYIDEHHTAEDVAISFGQSLNKALGNKNGLNRMWCSTAKCNNTVVEVVVDLSNRPYLQHNLILQTSSTISKLETSKINGNNIQHDDDDDGAAIEMINGDLSIEMFEHVLESIAMNAKMTVHIVQHHHHMNDNENIVVVDANTLLQDTVNATAIAFGRALRYCIMIDKRRDSSTPASSKGTLSV